jgi:hypothetical protein
MKYFWTHIDWQIEIVGFVLLDLEKQERTKKRKKGGHKVLLCRKSLKIPKGQSESVYRRRTDTTMAKRKSTKGKTTINKTYI